MFLHVYGAAPIQKRVFLTEVSAAPMKKRGFLRAAGAAPMNKRRPNAKSVKKHMFFFFFYFYLGSYGLGAETMHFCAVC